MAKRRILTIGNQKGGVGKTTLTVTLAHGLALLGKRVLIVDTDPQGQAATFLGLRQESGLFDLLVSKRPLGDVLRSAAIDGYPRDGLALVPGDKRTATAQMVLVAEAMGSGPPVHECLATALARADVDYIVFDTSPSVGALQEAALYASDWLLAPVAVDYPATEGLAGIIATLQAVNGKGGACKLLAVVPTMFDTTRESDETLKQIRGNLGDMVTEPIHRAAIMRECAAEGVTIWEKPKARPAEKRAGEEYARLVRMVTDAT